MTTTASLLAAKQEQKLFQVKSGLAKLLAMENIQVMHKPGITTAAFDVLNRQLFLPLWQNISDDLYDMLVVHEVGHALFTPASALMKGIDEIAERSHGSKVNSRAKKAIKNFMNVVEDARIDKLQKRKYPGSKRNYLAGYKELLERDFFGIKSKNVNTLTFIDRANIYFKGGLQNLNIQFSPSEKVLIARMEKLETFDEVIALTEEIYNLSKTNTQTITVKYEEDEDGEYEMEVDDDYETYSESEEDDEEAEDDEKVSSLSKKSKKDEDEDGEEGDEVNAEGSDSEEDEEGDGEGDEDEDADEGEDQSTDLESKKEEKKTDAGGEKNLEDIIPECKTEEHAEHAAKSIIASDDYNYLYVNIPKFNHSEIIDDYPKVMREVDKAIDEKIEATNRKRYNEPERQISRAKYLESLNTWKSREKDTVNFMIKEFEMRKSADTYARQSIAKTGVIDTNKLHSYKFNDDIFRRLTVIPQGKNHGFVMLLDWSSSMTSELQATMKQLFSLVMFCKKVQIPFEVYTFRMPTNQEGDPYSYGNESLKRKQFQLIENSLIFAPFKLRNVLSSRMNFTTLNRAYENLWMMARINVTSDPMDSTPLNQAILALDKVIIDFRAKNKLQIVSAIVLTDGGSDPVYNVNLAHPLPRRKGTKSMITDDVTKNTYFLDGDTYSWGYKATETFLNILRDRTGCNLIGFYLHSTKLGGYLPGVDDSYTQTVQAQEFWKKNNFIGVPSAGYDEYYILNANALASNANAELNVDSNMTSKRVVKEFIKFFGKKSVNRVLLSRFIERIANERKRA